MKKFIAVLLTLATCITCAFAFTACNPSGKTVAIGVQKGTTGESYVKGDADWGFAGIPNATASAYDNPASALQDMLNGNLNYLIFDGAVAKGFVEANSDKIKIVDIPLTVEQYAIGVNPNDAELLNKVNDVINTIKSDGTLEAIYAAYANISDNQLPSGGVYNGVESGDSTAQNKLVVATNAEYSPYEYKVGNKFYGIDMEIAKIIADTYELELVIDDMSFDAVTTAVKNGDADIALACLTVNATRAKSVTFSTAYEEGAEQLLIVNKDNAEFDACRSVEDIIAVFKAKK